MNHHIKIIGICGSPRNNGNTSKLTKKVLEGASSAGAEAKFFHFDNDNLSFCLSCYQCVKKGHCIINDYLITLRNNMLIADALVIGSPTFEREISGQMKTFFDRLWFDIHRETFLNKYAVCVNTHNLIEGHTTKTLKQLIIALGYNLVGCVKSNKLIKFKCNISNDIKSQAKAYEMGIKLVKVIKNKRKYPAQDMVRKFFIKPILNKIDRFLIETQTDN